MMVVAIGGTLAAMAVLLTPSFIRQSQASSGIAQAVETIRSARDVAVSQRRNVEIRFIGNNEIQTVRQNIPAGTTMLRSVQLENGAQFALVAGVPDTPDAFGNPAAVAFGPAASRMFTSEGTLVNTTGDLVNGTLFLAIPGVANSARAITIFGTTGLLRVWRWDGGRWVE
jgi:Tfp pilus assembly protein FimT